jgi:DNA-binding NarL/FixJ family response regulator
MHTGMNEHQNPLRVMLVDDHAIFRHGMQAVLEHAGAFDVVAECGDGESALAAYLALRPDVLLLDLRMPRLDGLEVVRRVLEADRAARILIMTTYATDEDIGHALRAGARGYLLKDAAPQELCRAIEHVAEGGMVIAPDIAAQYVRITTRARAFAARAADRAHARAPASRTRRSRATCRWRSPR